MSRALQVEPWRDLSGVRFVRYVPKRYRNLTRMARERPEAWRAEWERINRQQPDLAMLLKDPVFQATRDMFNAEVLIDVPPSTAEVNT